MTADLINLNKARKARAKQAAKAEAAQNRAKFGRPKAQSALDKALADKAARALDDAKRDPTDER
jgi:hypothetical protein